MQHSIVSGSFDDIRFRDIRFLEEASASGSLHVLLWSDDLIRTLTGKEPTFMEEERRYFLEAVRYVERVTVMDVPLDVNALPVEAWERPLTWVVMEAEDAAEKRVFCSANNIQYRVVAESDLAQVSDMPQELSDVPAAAQKVVVTGCFDWLHSGHVRFFEETSELGDLYVVLGHDDNVKLLKGKGHPLFPEKQRRYMVQSIRFVKQALVSTGQGWMDAEPEIAVIKPDIYAVNEDGDKPEKRSFCEEHGLEYVVLKRLPKEGLPGRESTALRGF